MKYIDLVELRGLQTPCLDPLETHLKEMKAPGSVFEVAAGTV